MDPDVTYTTLDDEHATIGERVAAARDLLTWLYGGGFMPKAWPGTREELVRFCQLMRDARHMTSPTPPTPSDQL